MDRTPLTFESRRPGAHDRYRRLLIVALSSVMALVFIALVFMDAALAQEVEPAAVDLADISQQLSLELQTTDGPVTFLVVLKDQLSPDEIKAASALQAANADSITREARIATSYHALTTHAKASQSLLRTWLDELGVDYRPFYIVNLVEVTGDASLVDALRRRPDVDRLIGNPQVDSLRTSMASDASFAVDAPWLNRLAYPEAAQSQDLPYGLRDTDAVEVWALGYTGQGITIASQDTGVQWDHPALEPHYRGWHGEGEPVQHPYNWFDAWGVDGRPPYCDQNDAQIPCDDHGHGTHTVGTMLGNATADKVQVGMAPDSDWIGCRNMDNGVGTPGSYTDCFQFFLAPYPQGGDPFEDGRPELAPHIVNNSWGCPPSEGCDVDSLQQIVETVRAAGIFVVASAGNHGSSCETVNDPIAIYDATFSIGAYDFNGAIASFSSRGPVSVDGSGRTKPDISAPGVYVYSTTVNDGYSTLSGTSMASPHVVGATALLWSAVPALIGEIDRTEQVLVKSTLPAPVSLCGSSGQPTTPNNVYGYGRLNALQAVELAQHPAKVTVQVSRQSENGSSETPLPGITLTLTDQLTGYRYETTTTDRGEAVFPQVLAGTYGLEASDNDEGLVSAELEFDQDVAMIAGEAIENGIQLRYAVTGITGSQQRLYLPRVQN